MSGKGGPPRLGTQYSWPPAGHPAPLDRPGATPPLPPQAWGRPSLSVCFQEPEKQGPEFSGESPPGGVVPPPSSFTSLKGPSVEGSLQGT